MNKKKIYDFHTHISSLEVLEAYYDQDVIPVINCQSRDEFKGLIDKREVFSKDRIHFMDDLYYSMGIHPFDADIVDQQFGSSYEDLIKDANLIGEIGMDACWCDTPFEDQERAFVMSLDLAKKYNKPIILHTKMMEARIYEILKDYDLDMVIHWYSCDKYVREFIDLGCHFTVGPAIFVDENVRNMVKLLPLDRILVETDGVEAIEWLFKKKFDPGNLRNILEAVINELADIKHVSFDVMSDYLLANSERLLRKDFYE
ncbi:TatD family hydrolase [Peptostreptococcus stomatis]|uniref:Hydrolase, TatD family n=2 Tax=Peptostreptococcus TaxID=1257 RepID=E0E334_9FIRM|nr:TatD family hydrolase [Peptostreptococcus stomatis]EFM64692.1 hydrolase, TatD family [Peptostreptococcus stomatis DSM 17678]MBL6465447.1 TatD family hydrolase [Peptostreptococcus stomatis]